MAMTEEETIKMLKQSKHRYVRIRSDKNNPNYKTEICYVNGIPFQIEVGKDVLVPELIADMLIQKGVI